MLRINNPEPSQCSTGCESGWTMYLDQSLEKSSSQIPLASSFTCKQAVFHGGEEQDEEEEDLSMVSDASSGPPQFQSQRSFPYEFDNDDDSDNNGCFCYATSMALDKNIGKRRRVGAVDHDPSSLDDTASSPLLNFSKHSLNLTKNTQSMENVLDFSQGFSATHLKGKAAFQKHLGFLQSVPAKPICRGEGRNKLYK